jgi:hypothetical protein
MMRLPLIGCDKALTPLIGRDAVSWRPLSNGRPQLAQLSCDRPLWLLPLRICQQPVMLASTSLALQSPGIQGLV